MVGCNIEDAFSDKHGIRTIEDAAERIKAVVKAANEAGVPDFVINARVDVLAYGGNITDVIERGKWYLEAGATTVFVLGFMKWDIQSSEVEEMVKAFKGKLALSPGSIWVGRLKELGVSRVSVGGALLRKLMSVLEGEAIRLKVL